MDITNENLSKMETDNGGWLLGHAKPLSANPTKWFNTLKRFAGFCLAIIYLLKVNNGSPRTVSEIC